MRNPWDDVAEGYCYKCKGFTTDYDSRGECREHHVPVTAEITTQEDDEDENSNASR